MELFESVWQRWNGVLIVRQGNDKCFSTEVYFPVNGDKWMLLISRKITLRA